jgi:hypothetical protein
MTSQDLVKELNEKYGIDKHWPKKYLVDTDTYANCCNAVFSWALERQTIMRAGDTQFISVAIGPNGGIMFKNVELTNI